MFDQADFDCGAGSRRLAACALVAFVLVQGLVSSRVGAAEPSVASGPASSCQPFADLPVASGRYTVQTDEWNSSATQCVSTDGNADFDVTQSDIDSGSNAPGSYPSIFRGCHWGTCTQDSGLPIQVSALDNPTTTWSAQSASGTYDVSYDVWFNQTPTTSGQPNGAELMVWLNHQGQVQPAGSQIATVNLDGYTMDVWFDQAQGFDSVAYVIEGGTWSVSNLNLGTLINDAVGRGYISPDWYLIDVEAGFEIWNGGTGLATNSFSLDPTGSTGPSAPSGPPVTRIAGSDNIGTAIAASQAEFPRSGSASAVVLARSDYFADALAGGPLAAMDDGPLLLTPGAPESGTLDPGTAAEIQRVLPAGRTVYLLGGDLALSPAIDTALQALGYTTLRIAGTDEYGTAVAIANALGNPTTVFEVTGLDFHDALSAVPAAITTHGAILLTDGSAQAPETAAYLAAYPGDTRYAVGGTMAAYGADPTANPVFGPDLYATAVAVAQAFFPDATGIGIATSASFSDALVAGPPLGRNGEPILSVPPTGALPASLDAYLASRSGQVTSLAVYGGTEAVDNAVVSAVDAALG